MPYKDKNKQKAFQAKHYLDNKETYYRRSQVTREANRDKKRGIVNDYKVSRGCCQCGEKHPAALDFHHTEDNKEFDIGEAVAKCFSIARIIAEMQKCDILCSNCHRKLHYNERMGLLPAPTLIRSSG